MCETDGKVYFQYAWLQNVDTRQGKKHLFVGGLPFYGKAMGEKDSGLLIKPGE